MPEGGARTCLRLVQPTQGGSPRVGLRSQVLVVALLHALTTHDGASSVPQFYRPRPRFRLPFLFFLDPSSSSPSSWLGRALASDFRDKAIELSP
jgi:hypothetical protein